MAPRRVRACVLLPICLQTSQFQTCVKRIKFVSRRREEEEEEEEGEDEEEREGEEGGEGEGEEEGEEKERKRGSQIYIYKLLIDRLAAATGTRTLSNTRIVVLEPYH